MVKKSTYATDDLKVNLHLEKLNKQKSINSQKIYIS